MPPYVSFFCLFCSFPLTSTMAPCCPDAFRKHPQSVIVETPPSPSPSSCCHCESRVSRVGGLPRSWLPLGGPGQLPTCPPADLGVHVVLSGHSWLPRMENSWSICPPWPTFPHVHTPRSWPGAVDILFPLQCPEAATGPGRRCGPGVRRPGFGAQLLALPL